MADIADERYQHYLAVLHPDRRRVYVLTGPRGWHLPEVEGEDLQAVASAMRASCGVEGLFLGRLFDSAADGSTPTRRVRLLAAEGRRIGDAPPPEARWVDAAAVRGARVWPVELRLPLAAWLDTVAVGGLTSRYEPWASPGWFDEACTWIAERASRAGICLLGPVQQASVRPWSCVLRAPAAGGDLYFKACPPALGFEAALCALLHELAPGRVPATLAWDADRGWILLADGGASFRGVRPQGDGLARWEDLLRQLADLQRLTVDHAERLVQLGCPDRRLAMLPGLYAEFVADEKALGVGRPWGVSPDDQARLRAFRPEVERLCSALAAFGLPEALHHDDLGPGNVLVGSDGRFVFADWGDSAVAHPFCSAFIPLRVARLVYDAPGPVLDRLREAYLTRWLDYGPAGRMREAFVLAHRLGALQRALTWHAGVPQLDPTARLEHADAPAYFLLHFLDGRE